MKLSRSQFLKPLLNSFFTCMRSTMRGSCPHQTKNKSLSYSFTWLLQKITQIVLLKKAFPYIWWVTSILICMWLPKRILMIVIPYDLTTLTWRCLLSKVTFKWSNKKFNSKSKKERAQIPFIQRTKNKSSKMILLFRKC